MRFSMLLLAFCSVEVMASPTSSLPADTVKYVKEHTVDEVVITAKLQSASVPEQSLSGERLQSLATSSVADALKLFAGVQIKDYGGLGGQKTVNVRSLGTQHTGVYIDGIRITNCQNGTVDLGKYSLRNMESISVFNSNKVAALMTASEYASAATVYLTTRRPQKTEAKAIGSIGSFGTYKGSLYASYKSNLFIDFESLYSKGDYPFSYHSEYEDTTGVRRNSDITSYRVELGYFTKHISAHAYTYYSDRGLPGGVVRRLSDKFGDVGREKDLNTFVQASYSNVWGKHSFKYNVRYANDYLHARSDYLENQFVHYNNTYRQQDVYNGAVYSFKNKRLTAAVSPDFRWSDLKCNVYGMSYVSRTDFKASALLRYTGKHLDASGSFLYTDIKDHSKMNTADRLEKGTYSLNVSYSIDKFSLRAFYKTIFRAPTLNDLYYTHVGKRTLKPEYTKQFDFGVLYQAPHLRASIDYYHNNVTDKIICVPQGGNYNWRMTNRGYVTTDGIDLSVHYNIGDFFFIVNGTWQDVIDKTDPEDKQTYNHRFLYSPKHSVTATAMYNTERWQVSLSHMYCSERYWTYVESDILSDYNNTDIKVQYKFKKYAELSFELNDVFDVRYEVVQRWPLPGRRFMSTLTFKI